MDAGLLVLPSLYLALAVTGNTPETRKATYYASMAYYKQSGMEAAIQPQIKAFEDKYVPESLQKFGIGATFIYRIAVDNRIELAWSF